MKEKTEKEKKLRHLLKHIAENYGGDYATVSSDLHKAIYWLHFIKEEEISRAELQELCFSLHQLGECFHNAHLDQRIRDHTPTHPG